MDYFYIDKNGQQCGPVPSERLTAHGVTPHTFVWIQGMTEWQKAGNLDDLRPLFYANPSHGVRHASTSYDGFSLHNFSKGNVPPMPDTNLVWAILSTVMCCWPIGIYAIICASKVEKAYDNGLYDDALRYSKKAKDWSIISAVACLVLYILAVIFGFFVAILDA